VRWFREELERMLLDHVARNTQLQDMARQLEADVSSGALPPAVAASRLLQAVLAPAN
jgi:hypothetical protein